MNIICVINEWWANTNISVCPGSALLDTEFIGHIIADEGVWGFFPSSPAPFGLFTFLIENIQRMAPTYRQRSKKILFLSGILSAREAQAD